MLKLADQLLRLQLERLQLERDPDTFLSGSDRHERQLQLDFAQSAARSPDAVLQLERLQLERV